LRRIGGWILVTSIAGITVLAVAAPYAAWAQAALTEVLILGRRAAVFPRLAWHRDARCSIREIWSRAAASRAVVGVRDALGQAAKIESGGRYTLVQVGGERFWIPAGDYPALLEMIEERAHDIYGVESRLGVRAGDIVRDCGANIGAIARQALQAGAKLVVAVEPGPDALVCLRRNLATEIAAGRAIVYPKGVWDKDAVLELTTGDHLASTASSVAIDRGKHGVKIPVTTIDNLVAELNLPRVDFIKMDIEGAEAQALAGAVRTVERFRPRMAIALEHRPSDVETLPRLAARLWPRMRAACACENIEGRIRPHALFLQ